MKILLLGAFGQVGWELQRSLAVLGELESYGRNEVDLNQPDKLKQTVKAFAPDIIVNAAAYTAVDKAESDIETAEQVNSQSVALLAELAQELNAWLIHYSTDYVYDGSKDEPYIESDSTAPQSVYGRTKLHGEEAIRRSGCHHLIFRTSWVYARRGHNFVKTMLRLASERDELKVVADQIGAPTSAELIADISAHCIKQIISDKQSAPELSGTYHLTPMGSTSWHGFTQKILQLAASQGANLRIKPDDVIPITTEEYPVPAKRPANSRLNCTKLSHSFGVYLPGWQHHVKRLISELVQSDTQ